MCRNTFLTRSVATPPVSVIRTGPKWWAEPVRMVRQKLMFFTLGVDQLPLRRTAVIQKDLYRCHMCRPPVRIGDTTGHKCSRAAQLTTCGIVAFSTRTIICSIFSAATSAHSYAHTRATQPNYREGQMTAMWGVTQCRAIATAVLLCPFRRVKFTRGENEGCGGIQKRAKKKKMQTK